MGFWHTILLSFLSFLYSSVLLHGVYSLLQNISRIVLHLMWKFSTTDITWKAQTTECVLKDSTTLAFLLVWGRQAEGYLASPLQPTSKRTEKAGAFAFFICTLLKLSNLNCRDSLVPVGNTAGCFQSRSKWFILKITQWNKIDWRSIPS